MLKSFGTIEDMLVAIDADKNVTGINAGTANRFPVRFVLFDNFRDSYEFISKMSDKDIEIQSVDKWMNPQYDDMFISRIELANNIENYIEDIKGKDCVVAPFSELARFYDNIEHKEFDALITKLKSIQSTNTAFDKHQRIYIVIVGQYSKISNFENDPQMFAWYLKSDGKQFNYRLVLSNGTDYDVRNLKSKYTVVKNLKEWLYLWRNGMDITNTIISTSPSIYAYEQNALPDNAFDFDKCENVYKFLTLGLKLSFGNVQYKECDDEHWRELAEKIDVTNFSFSKFIKQYFHLFELKDYRDFIKAWHNIDDAFDKWLLVTYYLSEFDKVDYLFSALQNCRTYTDRELFEQLMLSIFDFEDMSAIYGIRIDILRLLKHRGALSKEAQETLEAELVKVAINYGYKTAVNLLTPFTSVEKEIAIKWYGEGNLAICDLRANFPMFYCYLQNNVLPIDSQEWIESYIEKYKKAKFSNKYDRSVGDALLVHSANDVAFNSWYQDFKTVRTILADRDDIDVFYWIDGLGVDWIPVVRSIIEAEKQNGIYLNEVIIGKSLLPTVTSINKADLEKLTPDKLVKIGDLDNLAHKTNNRYPEYILEEFDIMANAIRTIIDEYAGKKIAIVSDHGLTHLSQHCSGLNLAGFESDHHGRLAKKNSGILPDNKYVVVNGNTVCALEHSSLCSKVPVGQAAHGGATPEEVLVPIFIISDQESVQSWTVKLLTKELPATTPMIRFEIKGLKDETPCVVYNSKPYKLSKVADNEYQSARIELVQNVEDIVLCIGTTKQKYHIDINFGAEEEDLF